MPKKNLKTDFERLIGTLENLILTGVIKPRERLIEAALSERLKASRYWIRDALKILEAKGLVEIIPYKGALVKDLDEKEIEDVFVIRVVLERLATHLALGKIRSEDINTLRRLTRDFEINSRKKNIQEMIRVNEQFHGYIFNLSGNRPLVELINDLRRRLHIIRFAAWSSPEVLDRIIEEHQTYLNALREKNIALLDTLSERHISYSKNLYLSQLKTIRALVGDESANLPLGRG